MSDEVKNLLPAITEGITTTARPKPEVKRDSVSKVITQKASQAVQRMGHAVDSLISVFAPQTALNRIQCRQAIRSYDASKVDRTTADVDYRRTDSDSELRSRRVRLMGISREEQRNDPFFSNGIRTIRNNVIGDDKSEEGISIHADIKLASGESDEKSNEIVNKLWDEDKKRIDLTGRWHFNDLMSIASNSLIANGEVLAVMHEIAAIGSDVPFSIELIETDQLPTSNEMWSSGAYAPFAPIKDENGTTTGYILDGIEYDTYRRIVAYHVLQFHPGNEFLFQPLKTRRVPVQRIIHYFEPNRAGAARGAPFAVAGLNSIFNSNELIKSENAASRAQTCFPLHFKTIPSALPFTTNGNGAPVYDSAGNPVEQIQTSMYTYGDSEPVMLKNERVNSQFIPFLKFEGMRAGASMNLSPSSYMKDSSGLNFSSLREDKTEDRRGYRSQQGLHARYFIEKFWPGYIRALALSGKIAVKSIDDFKRYCGVTVEMPDWGYVNPEQEVKADAMAVALGKKLPRDLFGKRRPNDHFKKFAEDIKAAKEQGLDFSWFEGEVPGSKKSSGNDDSTDQSASAPKAKAKKSA